MTFDEFKEKYKPVFNNENSSYDGYMFGLNDNQASLINPNYLWTLIAAEDENEYIIPGKHLVNRMGYFITEREWITGEEEVNLNEMITTGQGKYAAIQFIEEQLGIPVEEFEDKIHDFWSQKF